MNNNQMKKYIKKCESECKNGARSCKFEKAYIARHYKQRLPDMDKIMRSPNKHRHPNLSKYEHLLQEPKNSPHRNQEMDSYEAIERDMNNKLMEEIDKEDLKEADLISEADYDAWNDFRADEKKAQQDEEFFQYGENNELTEEEMNKLYEHLSEERCNELWKSFKQCHNV